MITGRPQKSLRVAMTYFKEHLAAGDHHAPEQEIRGEWFGAGVARLGFTSTRLVTEKDYLSLCQNLDPRSGQQLTVRQRQDRRVSYDFVASAPKSLSLLALTMGDRRLIAVHDEACRVAVASLEKAAATRVRRGGQRADRMTGEIVAVLFRHDTSRDLDPQLHTHIVVFNATWDPVEQRWKALESRHIYDQCDFLTEVYRSELAIGLQKLGYRLRPTVHGFEVEGVSREIVDRFSKRRLAIAKEEARVSLKSNRPVDNNRRAALARVTRQRKLKDITSDEVVKAQRSQLSGKEIATLNALVQPGNFRQLVGLHTGQVVTAREAVDHAVEHLFERHSVVGEFELLREALRFGQGCLKLPQVKDELSTRPEILARDGMLTTREGLRREQRMVSLVRQGLDQCRPLNAAFAGDDRLSDEQRTALHGLLRSSDRVIALRGGAGTGKTFLLKELVRAVSQRQEVFVFAPKATAVDVLRKEKFPDPQTVQLLLASKSMQDRVRGKTVLVEEAGLLSTDQMLALLELTQNGRGRLLLVGDTQQHTAIEAGDALRILETQGGLRSVRLQSIRRQIDLEYRNAIAEIARGNPTGGLSRLERMGAVCDGEGEVRYEDLAADYVGSIRAGKSALIVCPTWRAIDDATNAVRHELKESGLLASKETEVTTHRSLKWTEAQKRNLREYRPGLVLSFHKATADFSTGEWGEVVSVSDRHLTVARADGRKVRVTGKQRGCFDVAEKRKLSIAPGERLLLQGNRQRDGLLNGQIVTVQAVGANQTVLLNDGRRMPSEFRTFSHGYAVTSPASQNKTVDHIYLAVDSHSGKAANRQQFYVSASRGSERIKIYTDDVEFLREAVQRPGARQSALELIQSPGKHVHQPAAVRVESTVPTGVKI